MTTSAQQPTAEPSNRKRPMSRSLAIQRNGVNAAEVVATALLYYRQSAAVTPMK